MKFDEQIDNVQPKEVELVIRVVSQFVKPKKTYFIGEPKKEHSCYRCNESMCIVGEIDKEMYYQCFFCGHRELKL
jgi:hypothetical protein